MRWPSILVTATAVVGGLVVFLPRLGVAGDLPRRDLVALEESGMLVRFRSDQPGTIEQSVRLFHWPPQGDEIPLMTLATRPATGELYGLSRSLELVTIDVSTGSVVRVGPGLGTSIPGFGSQYMWLDFDAERDVARVVDASGRQVRVNPESGLAIDGDSVAPGVQSDADWHWGPDDPVGTAFAPVSPLGFAYGRDPDAFSRTTAYAIVAQPSGTYLVTVGDPGDAASVDGGEVHTVGPLGGLPGGGGQPFGFTADRGEAFLELRHPYDAGSYLTQVDLAAGTYGPQPDFSLGAASPLPANQIGVSGKANFNALAWLPLAGPSEPSPPQDPPSEVVVRRGKVRLDRLRHPADSVRLRGTARLSTPLRSGGTVHVSFGAASEDLVLDGRLRGAAGGDRVRFKIGRSAEVKFRLRLESEDLSGELAVPKHRARLTLPLRLTIDGEQAEGGVPLVFTVVTPQRAVAKVR